jgi:serine/threonine protein kinase
MLFRRSAQPSGISAVRKAHYTTNREQLADAVAHVGEVCIQPDQRNQPKTISGINTVCPWAAAQAERLRAWGMGIRARPRRLLLYNRQHAMLLAGTRLGPYETVAPIGAGGMGEVYRARDTRLNRDVAVKVLGEGLVNDPDRL